MENSWTLPVNVVVKNFNTDLQSGLSTNNVNINRAKFGLNVIAAIKPASILELILEGIRAPMMIVLLTVGGLSLVFGKVTETIMMVFVVALYITVEFINKYRNDRIMVKLKKLTFPTAKVIRDEKFQEIMAEEVVVGDILVISEGTCVPTDARLIEAVGLTTDEASLTGESLPIEKNASLVLNANTPLAEQRNMVFSGTTVVNGEGKAIVVAVGAKSELGKVAKEATKVTKSKTVLQDAMTHLAKILALYAIGVSVLIPAIGFLRGLNYQEMIVTWLALTFLMIPGQPPIIITMALALASFKLAKIKMLVKRLHGVEALSQVTAIVTDKTGTITENHMQVESFILPDGKKLLAKEITPDLKLAILHALPRYGKDPTDEAVRTVVTDESQKLGIPLSFKGFSEQQPWRAIEYDIEGKRIYYLSGKVEGMLEKSNNTLKETLEKLIQEMNLQGKRVVAYGYSASLKESDTIYLAALAVLSDPIRNGVPETLKNLNEAAIKTFIVTGDHSRTAEAIALKLGITNNVVTGQELDKLDDHQFSEILNQTNIFARITSSQKLRIVNSLKKQGEVVAVIGDGINDAPALRAADVGIAMGEIGTDLAKEASDLVLSDDNYTHVLDAIGIARSALDNFRKGLTYYLTAKGVLLAIFLVSLILGIPFPFAPIHIILTELLMDLASSTIFVTEAAEADILKKKIRVLKEYLGKELIFKIAKNGLGLAIGITGLYLFVYYHTGNIVTAQTTGFATWLLGHIVLALNLKQEKLPLIKQGIFSNQFGAIWLIGMILLSLLITTIKPLHFYMKTVNLPVNIWGLIIFVVVISTCWIETVKILKLQGKRF